MYFTVQQFPACHARLEEPVGRPGCRLACLPVSYFYLETLPMASPLLPVVTTLLISLSTFAVSAADRQNPLPSTSSERRAEVDDQREHITGADLAVQKTPGGAQTVVDAPIDTADAPGSDADH
ncbi:hypothetical protein ALP98_00571 [Pseudomonas viridiflava]|uniref:Uncharacterized protein n=4 Tax=Pseudomonas syringae group TaxID=136849 RepID=A0A3M4PEG6_PSEVI|nr:hypothetical protein ALQ09_03935 [Pseudomonas viridiflava]RMQ76512.1 hypothetical protein ALP98_00571 [Pseudomonas viridiflava]